MEEINIPLFAEMKLAKQACPYCHREYMPQDVCAAGIRRHTNGKSCFFYEANCPTCDNPSRTVIDEKPCSMYGLAVYIAEMYEQLKEMGRYDGPDLNLSKPDAGQRRSKPEPSKITDEEVARFQALVRESPSHLDFLHDIGMSEEEIRKAQEEQDEE